MIEFAQNYGLWIALAGVFIAMHWFGMGCCSGRREEKPTQGQGVPGKKENQARVRPRDRRGVVTERKRLPSARPRHAIGNRSKGADRCDE